MPQAALLECYDWLLDVSALYHVTRAWGATLSWNVSTTWHVGTERHVATSWHGLSKNNLHHRLIISWWTNPYRLWSFQKFVGKIRISVLDIRISVLEIRISVFLSLMYQDKWISFHQAPIIIDSAIPWMQSKD